MSGSALLVASARWNSGSGRRTRSRFACTSARVAAGQPTGGVKWIPAPECETVACARTLDEYVTAQTNTTLEQINFIVFGASLLSTVPALRQLLRGGVGARSYPTVTALSGLCLVVLAFIAQDPAPGYDPEQLGLSLPTVRGLFHIALAGVAMLSSVAGLFIMAARFARDSHWRSWVRTTQLVAVFAIGCVIVYGVWSTKPTGFAGVFERLAILASPLWALAFAHRLGTGVPFMIAVDQR